MNVDADLSALSSYLSIISVRLEYKYYAIVKYVLVADNALGLLFCI